ncbi:hypothetical protein [Natrinema sp. SYSU A 869]|uniref:hypothetical protein n=1 Tax=Natrinema sp. SYSU A 869 TaxID=2871694 RepID=UPI001CA46AE4|nr:hypothetical protein [Natrinema sp. SYSU A 869]
MTVSPGNGPVRNRDERRLSAVRDGSEEQSAQINRQIAAVISVQVAGPLVTDESDDHRDCELCGERVPAAIYHEHLLKECPGR